MAVGSDFEKTTSYVQRKKVVFLRNGVIQGNPHLNARRCGAKAKSTGLPCRGFAVKGKKVCRMHGGASGSGAQPGNQNALKHGQYTRERKAEIKRINLLCRELLKEAEEGLSMF